MADFSIEKTFNGPVIGLDEVGRGPLAGPVVSCGCYFKNYNLDKLKIYNFELIKDSKKLSPKNRKLALHELKKLKKNKLVQFNLGIATVDEIDNLNILNATKLSMTRVIKKFKILNPTLIIDGNFKLDFKNYKEKSIIKGDELSISIAAASIIAKVYRDRLMSMLSKRYTQFDWEKNSGYGTAKHIHNIKLFGPTAYHRKSFEPIKSLIHMK